MFVSLTDRSVPFLIGHGHHATITLASCGGIEMVMMPMSSDRQVRTDRATPTLAKVMVLEKVNSLASEDDQSLVVLRYGTTCWRLPAGNWTVGQAKRWARSVWGVGYFVDACLNDQVVSLDAVPQSGDTLVFVRPPGRKGAEDWSDEAKGLFACYPELRTIAEDATSRGLDTRRSVELVLVMAVSFFIERFGNPERSDMARRRCRCGPRSV